MRTEDLKLIEDYLDGKLESEALSTFENRLREDPTLTVEIERHKLFVSMLKKTGHRNKVKVKLDNFHVQLSEEDTSYRISTGKRIHMLWQKHYPAMAIAASVSIITVATVLFGIDYLKNNKQNAYYRELKRDVERLKNTQKAIINWMDEKEQTPNIGATAFAIAKNGYLLASYHAVKDADSLIIGNDRYKRLKVKLIYEDPAIDLALLKIVDKKFRNFKGLPLAIVNRKARLGEKVYTLGYSKEDIVYGEGAISSATGYEGDITACQVSVPVNPGNSGSPLLDNRGNVIGMISGKHIQDDGASFAIKPGKLLDFIRSAPKHVEIKIRLSKINGVNTQSRPAQVEIMKDYIFMLKVYKQ